MSKELVLDNEHFSLWYHTESKIVHHEIKKYVFGKDLQDLLTKGSELLKSKGAHKWLSDDRNNNALSTSDSEWTDKVWYPNTVKLGWKYWALVQPEKIVGQMSMKKRTSFVAGGGVVVKIFSDPDEAMKWLSEQ